MANYTWDPDAGAWRVPFSSFGQFQHLQTYIRKPARGVRGIDPTTSVCTAGTVRLQTEDDAKNMVEELKAIIF